MPRKMFYLLSFTAVLLTLSSPALAQQPADQEVVPSATSTPVVLRIEPAGASVTLDGTPLQARRVELGPGEHTFTISAPGHVTRHETLRIEPQAGRELWLSVNLSRLPTQLPEEAHTEGLVDQMRPGARVGAGWALTGGGTALITVSVALAVMSTISPDCSSQNPSACGQHKNVSGWATFTGVLGGAALLGGLGLLNWGSLAGEPVEQETSEAAAHTPRPRTTPRVVLELAPSAVGLTVGF